MTDALLWSAFLTLCFAALYFAWPRPPAWDIALFHHLVLASFYRGDVEAKNGTLEDWKARIAADLPKGPRPPSGGWTEDPELLGPDYAPTARLGAGVSWDVLAARGAPLAEAISRRLDDVVVVWFGAVAMPLPGVRVHSLEAVDLEAVLALLPAPSTRVVLATSVHGSALLRALAAAPGLRDRVRALLLVGASFDEAWNAENLRHPTFDTELDRVTPWLVLRTNSAPDSTLSEPSLPASRRRSFSVHDLGECRPEAANEPARAEAMSVVLAALG